MDNNILNHLIFKVPEPEERALQDGRIGGETVLIDISSQCGTMNTGVERMEVHKSYCLFCVFFYSFVFAIQIIS